MNQYLFRLLLVLMSACLVLSGCGRKTSVIPGGVLSDIFFDMLVADQLISDYPELKDKADSMLVYEPIFNKYGYSTADYDRSISYYLQDPEKLEKIAIATTEKLSSEISRLQALQDDIRKIEEKNSIFDHYVEKDFTQDSVRWALGKMKDLVDSIFIENKWIISQENTDTLQTR